MAVSRPPAFQFYPKDWLSSASVSVMTLEQQAAYFNLLCHEWVQEDCGLPTDEVELARLSRLGKKWPKCRDRIIKQFVQNGDRFFNLRLLREREKQNEWRAKSSNGGKQGATKRWAKHDQSITTPILDSSPNDDIAVCSLQFALKEENISATNVAGSSRWFNEQHERWYSQYWCKRDKTASRRAFEKRIKQLVATGKTHEASVDFLIERTQFDRSRFEGFTEWEFRGNLYPATWLNGERWNDDGPRINNMPRPIRQERRAGYPPCPSCGCNPCSSTCRAALALVAK